MTFQASTGGICGRQTRSRARFATVRLRPRVTKGAGSKTAALAMAYMLLKSGPERGRRFNGHELVADLLDGVKFKDGIRLTDDDNHDDGMTDESGAACLFFIAQSTGFDNYPLVRLLCRSTASSRTSLSESQTVRGALRRERPTGPAAER